MKPDNEFGTLILHGTRRGIRVGVLSNGVAIDLDMIRVLEENTDSTNFMLQISLDSPDPEVNNSVRGKTDRALATIERVAASSIDLQLACVIHKLNLRQAHLMLDAFYPRVKRFHFLLGVTLLGLGCLLIGIGGFKDRSTYF